MSPDTRHIVVQPANRALKTVLWVGLVLLVSLSVLLINGQPLFYYDSPAYIDQGSKLLLRLGVGPEQIGQGTVAAALAEDGDGTVNGSRSAVFSLLAAILSRLGGIGLIPLANVLLIAVAAWLPMRVLVRTCAPNRSTTALVALPLIAAGAGSLPFYIAFIMPDILTGILLLMIATLTVFVHEMRKWEILLALALGSFAVVSHISHIAIALAMLPVVAIGALAVARKGWWIAPLLVLIMALSGIAERAVFNVAARTVADADVVYIPFLTARLIEDGPGLAYLQGKCPDANLASCALFEALSKSDDPMRLTASHIIFETNPDLGSFKFLSAQDQGRVAAEQYAFFFRVLRFDPVGTTGAIIKNTLTQARLNSVEMTIPDDVILSNTRSNYADAGKNFDLGRLAFGRDWLSIVNPVHTVVYVISIVIILGSLILPGRVPAPLRIFVVMCVLGILANAFVCGAVSQPADRYGARVIWLLPFLAMVTGLFMLSNSGRGAHKNV